jgi:excisionase family DNA binding protein
MSKQYYTKEEVKAILRISERTFFRYIKKGVINAVKIGGKNLISVKEIETLMKQNVK